MKNMLGRSNLRNEYAEIWQEGIKISQEGWHSTKAAWYLSDCCICSRKEGNVHSANFLRKKEKGRWDVITGSHCAVIEKVFHYLAG